MQVYCTERRVDLGASANFLKEVKVRGPYDGCNRKSSVCGKACCSRVTGLETAIDQNGQSQFFVFFADTQKTVTCIAHDEDALIIRYNGNDKKQHGVQGELPKVPARSRCK